MNEIKTPSKRNIDSSKVKLNPLFTSFNNVAPNIVGTARKKENSAAIVLEIPSNKDPIMVAPDLEVPGIMAKH